MQLSSPIPTPAAHLLTPLGEMAEPEKYQHRSPRATPEHFLFVQGRHRGVPREAETLSGTLDGSEGEGCEVTQRLKVKFSSITPETSLWGEHFFMFQ